MKNFTLIMRAGLFVLALVGSQLGASAQTQNTGWQNPSSGTNAPGAGNVNWTSPGNIVANDNSRAEVDLTNGQESRYLIASGFNLNIPAGATIEGIEVRIEKDAERSDEFKDVEVELLRSGSQVGTNKADLVGFISTTEQLYNYGGTSDLWGTSWTLAQVNSSSFSVRYRCERQSGGNTRWVRVDRIQVRVTYTPDPATPITINRSISASSDDAEQAVPSGNMSLTSSDLELPFDDDGTGNQTNGLRFTNITVPPNATISNAYVQFTADGSFSDPITLTIQGQDIDDAPTFTSSANNITSRTLTTASVSWSPDPWTSGNRLVDERTVDISSIIQEITSRAGWASGNDLVIIISGTGSAASRRRAESFDGINGEEPELFITYSLLPPPVVNITQPSANPLTIAVGTTVTLSGTATATGQTITSGEWNPGDGSPVYPFTGAGPFTTTHTYNTVGTYTATLSGTYNPTGTATTQIIVFDPDVATVSETYAANGTFTVPPGVTSIDIEAWGAGAGSGKGGGTEQGGGGGAYVGHTLTVVPGQTYTIVVPGPSSTETAGGDASVTLSGASTPVILAKGAAAVPGGSGLGIGGQAADCIPAASAQSGGNGGAEGSDNNNSGGGGSSGHAGGAGLNGEDSDDAAAGTRAAGGAAHDGTATGRGAGGAGGVEVTGQEDGLNGVIPGGGGGASTDGGSNAVGTGARGEIIITYQTDGIDLAVSKTVSNTTPLTGDIVTFEITASNLSGTKTASDVVVTDLLPSGYGFVNIDQISTGSYNSVNGVWSVGSLTANSSATLGLNARIECFGDYANVATIKDNGASVDTDQSNNTATAGVVPTFGPTACVVATDDFSAATNPSFTGVVIADILANDLLNGSAVAPTAVTLNITQDFPAGSNISLNTTTREVSTTGATQPGDYQLTYEICEVGNPSNCHTATVFVYISDLVDNYINQPVPLCQDVPDPTSTFGIEKQAESGYDVHLYVTPLMADIDNDGDVEIITMSDNGIVTTNGERRAQDILIINGTTLTTELTISTPFMSTDGGTPFALADVDGDGFGEIIIATMHDNQSVAADEQILICYEHTGAEKWRSTVKYGVNATLANGSSYDDGSASTVGIADFNEDGIPEVYVYNEIFNAVTGAKLADGGSNGIGDPGYDYQDENQAIPAAANLTSSPGLELACGRTVYNVTESGGSWTMTPINFTAAIPGITLANRDGYTGIADLDLDGNLDVIVAAFNGTNTIVYAWNPRDGSLISAIDIGAETRHGAFFIGDVDGNGTPNVGICQSLEVEMLEFSGGAFSIKWTLVTTDASGRTGLTMFDFNQDGKQEIVYRDETLLRIIDASGAAPVDLASFSVVSNTGMEGPIVGDVDGDGSAEIIVTDETGSTRRGRLQVYRSSIDPWAPARSVWNQYAYFNTHVSDDLSIPQFQSNHGQELFFNNSFCPTQWAARPLNNFNVQSTYYTVNGCPSFPVFDAEIEIVSATLPCPATDLSITFIVHNRGDIIAIPDGTPVAFYAGNPLGAGATLLTTTTLSGGINAGASSGPISFTINGVQPNTQIFAVANDDGSQTSPIALPTTGQFECDYTNNIAFFSARCELLNPDVNATLINVPVPGNVSTNDNVTTGTTYGTATLTGEPGGSNPTITLNPDGTYTFTGDVVGVYTYDVEVCLPGQTSGSDCEITELQITVTDPFVGTNSPTANTDIATTPEGTAIVLNTLANDFASSPGATLDPASVTIVAQPATGGTASVDPATGNITFTPTSGFTGTVTYEYTVCEVVATSNCATATQEVTVVGTGFDAVSAGDDYNRTVQGESINVAIADGLLINDASTNPAATLQVSQSSVGTFDIPGKGTLSIGANGGYIFTPDVGFTGPVSWPYEVCDATACANATLYIVVDPFETNPDINSTFVGVPVDGDVSTNDEVIDGTTYGTPTADGGNPNATDLPVIAADGTYTFTPTESGVFVFEVPVCLEGQTPVSSCKTELLTITVTDEGNVNGVPPIANTDVATTERNTPVTLLSLSNDVAKSAGATLDASSVTIVAGTSPSPSTEGTLTIDGSGNITFTPVPAFVGAISYEYQVCDDQSPALCATAVQEVTVLDDDALNTIAASDDYIETEEGVTVSGNVVTNDIDPEGNTLTVTAETVINAAGQVAFSANGDYTFIPAAGYTGPGEFVYEVCDNGTPVECTNATLHVLVNPELFDITGTAWFDPDGLSNDEFDGTAQGSADNGNAGSEPLYVNYIDDNGNVISTVPVEANGMFSLSVPSYPNAIVQLSTTQGVVGQPKPATTLPAGWGNTGEGIETGPTPAATGDGTPDGEFVVTLNAAVPTLNFGFGERPVTTASTTVATQPLPSGSNFATVDVTKFEGTDPDLVGGQVEVIRITDFPTNTEVFAIDGTYYYPDNASLLANCPTGITCIDFSVAGFVEFPASTNTTSQPVPTIQVDPTNPANGTSQNVLFTYSVIDIAGLIDENTGVVDVPFSGDRTVNVTSSSICIDDVPYLEVTVISNFDMRSLEAQINWTSGTPQAPNPGSTPIVGTVTQTESLAAATNNGTFITFRKLWPGGGVDSSAVPNPVATDWPGWILDPTDGWVAREDGFSGYREADTEIEVVINPADDALVSYPPSSPFCVTEPRVNSFTGTVWQDGDGSGDALWNNIQTGGELGTDAGGLFAYVIGTNPETGLTTVLDKSPINPADGTYSFDDCIQADDHTVILSTNGTPVQGDVSVADGGTGLPVASLPTGWAETSPITRTPISTLAGDVANADLGIHRIPTSGAPDGAVVSGNVLQGTNYNPGVIGQFDIPDAAFGGDDPDPNGAVEGLVITALSPEILSITDGTTTLYRTDADLTAVGACPTTTCLSLETEGTFEFAAGSNGQPTSSLSITPAASFLDGSVFIDYQVKDIAGANSDNTTQLEIPFIALKYDLTNGNNGWYNGGPTPGGPGNAFKPNTTDDVNRTLFWVSDPATTNDILDVDAVIGNLIVYPSTEAVITGCLTVNDGVQVEGTVRFKAVDDGSGGNAPNYGQYKGPALPNTSFEMILSEEGWHNISVPVVQENGSPITAQNFADANNTVNPELVNLTNDEDSHNLWWYDSEYASGKEQGFFMNRSSNTIADGLGTSGYSSHAYGTWRMVGGTDPNEAIQTRGLNYFVDANNAGSFPVTIQMTGTTNDQSVTVPTHDNWGGWNLIPNPFPVTLDVTELNGTGPNSAPDIFGTEFDRAIWIWNPGDDFESPLTGQFSKGAYVAVDASTGNAVGYPANTSNNVLTSSMLVAPMQSFYLRRTSASKTRRKTHGGGDPAVEAFAPNPDVDPNQVGANSNGDANNNDAARLTGVSAQGAHQVTLVPDHQSSCAIVQHYKTNWDYMMIYSIDETNDKLGDATEIVFDYTFSNGYDIGYDIGKLGTPAGAPVLFTQVENEAMVINKMAYPEEVTTVPMGFYAEVDNKPYRIQMAEMPLGWRVYLEDKLTGAWHDLTAGDYHFKNRTNFRIERFVLHFSMKSEPINPVKPEAIAWGTSQGIEITFNDMRSLSAEVLVTNTVGQVLHNNRAVSTSENYIIPINDNDPQVYMVTVITEELTTTFKVVR